MIKSFIKEINNLIVPIYFNGKKKNIFIFSTPRSGSTWLLELLASQSYMSYCFEPFDIRSNVVKKQLNKIGIYSWSDIYNKGFKQKLLKYKVLQNGYLKGRNPKILDLKRWRNGIFSNEFNFFSNRLVFKILHACEDEIDLIKNNFNCDVIFLIRHPIAVSLSRTVSPRLEYFIGSDYSNNFSSKVIKESKNIFKKGNDLERKVLSWCFQNSVPLKKHNKHFTLITYEQLVTNNEMMIDFICQKFDLNSKRKLSNIIKNASKTSSINKSNFNYDKSFKNTNIASYKEKINDCQEKKLMDILKLFDIDIYSYSNTMPNQKYLIK